MGYTNLGHRRILRKKLRPGGDKDKDIEKASLKALFLYPVHVNTNHLPGS